MNTTSVHADTGRQAPDNISHHGELNYERQSQKQHWLLWLSPFFLSTRQKRDDCVQLSHISFSIVHSTRLFCSTVTMCSCVEHGEYDLARSKFRPGKRCITRVFEIGPDDLRLTGTTKYRPYQTELGHDSRVPTCSGASSTLDSGEM